MTTIKFKHKYNVGDEVYFICEGEIFKGVIDCIHINTTEYDYVIHSSYHIEYEMTKAGYTINEKLCSKEIAELPFTDLTKL